MNETGNEQKTGQTAPARRGDPAEALRFLAVAVVGVAVDIAIAYALATLLGLPLWIAAALGFVAAAGANYVAHELWTFRDGARQLSLRRSLHYLGACAATLAVRLAVVGLLSVRLAGAYPLAILICGAGASFFVNFAISKLLIFSNRAGANRTKP